MFPENIQTPTTEGISNYCSPQTLSDFPFPQDKVNPFNDFQICDKNIFHTQEPLEIIFLPLKAFRS